MNRIQKIMTKLEVVFSALKHRNFRYFWSGQCVSLIGTWMQRAAQVWLVYSLTNSPFLLGLLGICQFTPILVLSLVAGVYVDRFPKKKILFFTQTAFMLQALTLTLLVGTGLVRYWHVLILASIFGCIQAIDMPARQSFFIELVGKDDLMNAISLNSTIVNLAKIIGPAFAGAVMVAIGPTLCFLFNGLSYIAVLWGLILIRTNDTITYREKGNVLLDIKEGIQYISRSSILRNTAVTMAIVCTFAMNIDVIIPVFSKTVLGKGASGYTSLLSAMGVGSLIGAIVMASRSKKGIKETILIADAFATSILQIVTSFIGQYFICMVLVASIGFVNLTFLNMANSTLQINSTDRYRGRVMSIYALLNQGTTPLGNFFAGTIMEHMGGNMGFFMCGIITLLLTAITLPLRIKNIHKQTVEQ